MLQVEVVFVDVSQTAHHETLTVPLGTTVGEVIERSGLLARFPDIATFALGTFARTITRDTLVEDGMRVEICRPLCLAPMERRRLRAAKKKKQR